MKKNFTDYLEAVNNTSGISKGKLKIFFENFFIKKGWDSLNKEFNLTYQKKIKKKDKKSLKEIFRALQNEELSVHAYVDWEIYNDLRLSKNQEKAANSFIKTGECLYFEHVGRDLNFLDFPELVIMKKIYSLCGFKIPNIPKKGFRFNKSRSNFIDNIKKAEQVYNKIRK